MTRPGDFVGAYQLVRHLGEGPFGMVWLARAPSSHDTCALKLLRPGFVDRPEGQEAFSRLTTSVSLHGRLHHPNLVEVYETVQDPPQRLYGLSMAYLEGQTLADTQIPQSVIQGQDLRGLATILSWFEELGAALSWLHTQRIVHGNLKPTNVVLTQTQGRSVVKILDLCWAAIGIAAPPPNAPWSVAPEQLRGQPPTKESDQWALASMLARMLSGGHPTLRLGVMPQILVMALSRALDESPSQRYAHMSELVGALRAIRTELEQRARSPSPVDADDFQDEPLTVRAPNLPKKKNGISSLPLRRTGRPSAAEDRMSGSGRHDTPPMPVRPDMEPTHREAPPIRRVHDLPMVPESRALSKEISDEHDASSISLEMGSGEHSGPAMRHDVGDPFIAPIVPDDFDRTALEGNEPSFSMEGSFVEDSQRASTRPSQPASRSRLTAYGVIFLVLAALIIVLALAIVGDSQPSLEGGETALRPEPATQPPDAPPPPEPPAVAPPPPPPPPIAPPPPAKLEKAKVEKAKPRSKDVPEDLDSKADEALAKLLGEPAPPSKPTDRELSVACDEGDGKACVEWGDRLAKRKSDKAVKVFERACTFSVPDGCHRAALLLKGDPKSDRLEERACSLGRKESCKPTEVATSSTS